MSLSVNDFKNVMMDSTNGATDGVAALLDLGTAIANYLKDNAIIDFSWNGINPGPPTVIDPVIVTTGEIISLAIVLTQSLATTAEDAMNFMANEITNGLKLGMFNITATGFSCTPVLMSDIPPLALSPGGDSREEAYSNIAEQIIDWITGYSPAGIILGSHGAFTAPTGTGGSVSGIS